MKERFITISIDTGGTFTDGFFWDGERAESVKVETTPHDLTVCFFNCIEQGSKRFDFKSLTDMLKKTEVIRYSTTIGSNLLIQKTGPKMGLIVTRGYERTLYKEKGKPQVIDFLIPGDMIIGIEEEVDPLGNIIKPPDEGEVKAAIKYLLEGGARIIAVSLLRSSLNAGNEMKVKEIACQDFPPHYMGFVPTLLSTQISNRPDDYKRTNAAVINTYLHRDMVRYLYKAEEELRRMGYTRPLLLVKNDAGVVRVARARAIDTYGSGPVSGLFGSASTGKLYGLENLICLDIGGTSTDIGFIRGGICPYKPQPELVGIPIELPGIDVTSISGGGGSVAKLASGEIRVGPESAGAMPGPVCYDLGGTEPTVTDAILALGHIDPNYFLGGTRKLNKDAAAEAIKIKISDPLNLEIEEAAFEIKRKIESIAAEEIQKMCKEKGYETKDFALFAFGGGGGCFCCGIMDSLGIPKVYTFNYNAIFSAVGVSTMDILHVYERFKPVILRSKSGEYLSEYKKFNDGVTNLQKIAFRDIGGEGFGYEEAKFSLELEMRAGKQPGITIQSPVILIREKEDVKTICDTFEKEFVMIGKPLPEDDVTAEIFRIKAAIPIPHYKPLAYTPVGADPKDALKGRREVYWVNGTREVNIYERKLLRCGNTVEGPAIIESEDTTYVIPEGKKYTVDKYLNGVIEKVG